VEVEGFELHITPEAASLCSTGEVNSHLGIAARSELMDSSGMKQLGVRIRSFQLIVVGSLATITQILIAEVPTRI
jgi:hypothetical protein